MEAVIRCHLHGLITGSNDVRTEGRNNISVQLMLKNDFHDHGSVDSIAESAKKKTVQLNKEYHRIERETFNCGGTTCASLPKHSQPPSKQCNLIEAATSEASVVVTSPTIQS